MGLSEKLLLIIVGGVIIFAIVGARAASPTSKPGCTNYKCGDVEIPFPFGLTKACYLDDSFSITCQSGKPMIGDVPVTNISIENHGVHVLPFVGEVCYDKVSGPKSNTYNSTFYFWAAQTQYTISNSKNKFIVLGCDTFAYLNGFQNGENYTIGCSSQCLSLNNVINGSCSGVGCCEVGFPDGVKVIQVDVYSVYNHTKVRNFNPCSYAFFVEKGKFNFSTDYLMDLGKEKLPMVLDWAVGNETCAEAQDKPNFACQENSECHDLQTRQGYRCNCKQGYKGNPYLHGGCQDVDECGDPTLNNCATPKNCINTQGNYTCGCPKSYHGDGRKDGLGCAADLALALTIKIAIGVGISLIAILGGISWVYFVLKNRKFVKLREKFFRQNGGLILEQQLKEHARSTEAAKIFTVEESEEERSLAMYFLSSLKENRLFEILDNRIVEGNEEQIKKIVELTERCLRVKGDERPTMKEVAMELELLRKTKTHPWVNVQSNLEEAEHMLGETYDAYEYGGRSSSTTL
ncbi:hypothetical protein FH972_001866 [Carpinus fangiana]|uniref:EGF-like domain-containing protein n=1 Tax=Carpinus fangiana TaxID=176857 RepID=A0A5N6QD32_9ROSI|nr:hypothetical protein FH972_001866 [Carpinus fangiana]